MVINVQHDVNITCRVVLQEQLDGLGIAHTLNGLGEVEIHGELSPEELKDLAGRLEPYGIRILGNPKMVLVQRIKDTIDRMLRNDGLRLYKISSYLSDQLEYSYSHLSNLFSEATYSSIENFVILRKVDYAKELIAGGDLSLTEIAYRLNYSSVAHLSNQFKKTTGLTPTKFQRILEKRREHRTRQLL